MQMSHIKYCSMEDKDIRHYLPNAKIITYDELSNLQNISELLPKHKSYVIILYPSDLRRMDIGYV